MISLYLDILRIYCEHYWFVYSEDHNCRTIHFLQPAAKNLHLLIQLLAVSFTYI